MPSACYTQYILFNPHNLHIRINIINTAASKEPEAQRLSVTCTMSGSFWIPCSRLPRLCAMGYLEFLWKPNGGPSLLPYLIELSSAQTGGELKSGSLEELDGYEWRCWEGLGAGREGDDRGWDSWMASPTRWTWVWVNFGSWWWTGRPGVLRFMGSQRVGHDWATELNWTEWQF